ncbi:hypothetical protein [Paraburkholderia sp. JPY419]|uniref:hypothetical protein n=1 Tax=Paraburkholderia sp. JPY419 TaxID=667660 RepID=UPI003D1E1065
MPTAGTPEFKLRPIEQGSLPSTIKAIEKWAGKMEEKALTDGRCLMADETAIAQKMRVEHPERVRVVIGKLPNPGNASVYLAMSKVGLLGGHITGLTFGYGIYIKEGHNGDATTLLSHELRHVKQYEDVRREKINYLAEYVHQLNQYGYRLSGFEQDAYAHQIPPGN